MRARARQRRDRAAVTAFLLAGALAAACGSERKLSAQEFTEEVNAQGVEFRLGKPLISADEEKQVYAVELEQLTDLPGAEEHGGGSLSVHEDSGATEDSMESCQASADLLCYRAANVVVVLESGGIEAQRLGVAIEKLSEE
ncbi:MAG: hypothetical protein ACRDL6_08460 [Solirubrobacterales bacterium]